MKQFKAIAAMSENRVIGADNRIPWHLPQEFDWFKRATTGQVIVMGRKTFESIGKPLPGRTTFVLSRSAVSMPGVRVVHSIGAIDLAHEARDVFICGGAEVYAQTLPLCSELYLTLVKRTVQGDKLFPPFEELFEPVRTLIDSPEFKVTQYQNRQRR